MKSKKWLVYLLASALIITGIYAKKHDFLLKTPHAPSGILSLELCFSNSDQRALLYEWKTNHTFEPVYYKDSSFKKRPIYALPTAIRQTQVDYGFIVLYVSLLCLLISISRINYNGFLSFKAAIGLVIIAGLMDFAENVFALSAMEKALHTDNFTGLALPVSIPSTIKWLLIIFSIGYYYVKVLKPQQSRFLIKFNQYSKAILEQVWNFRIVVIGLLALFLMLNLVDQGEDLLIAINSSGWAVFWFIMAIFVLALLNWYLPKTYDNADKLRQKKGFRTTMAAQTYQSDEFHIKKYLGRIAGSATLLVPATGILHAMQAYHISYWFDQVPAEFIFLLMIVLYVEVLRHKLLDKFYVKPGTPGGTFIESRFWATFMIAAALIVWLGIRSSDGEAYSLAFLSLDFFVMSFLFLLSVNYRERFKHQLPYGHALFLFAAAVFFLFVAFNFRPVSEFLTKSDRFFSLPVFIAGLVFYTLLFSLLLLAGRKYKIQFVTILLIYATLTSLNTITDFHKVSMVAGDSGKQDPLRAYIRKWLESRRSEIAGQSAANRDYPVFFVNAYGGGIKAAAWTTMVVGELNVRMRKDSVNSTAFPDFEHYAFSFSGASGGTIGLSLLAGARITYADRPLADNVFTDTAGRTVYEHDYLTNDIVGILGRDVLMGSTGRNCYADRAEVTEKSWEDYTRPHHICYDVPLSMGWQNKKLEVPLLFSNTYDIDGGVKGVLAPVKLQQSDFPGALLLQILIKKEQDIHLSSAAFLSARFPYVSPTGKFDENHHFTDGGTVENSGAETSLQVIHVFNNILDSLTTNGKPQDTIFKKVKICILSIPNSIPQMDSVERVRNVYEGLAPIAGILQTIDGNAKKAEITNFYLSKQNQWHYYKMVPHDTIISHGQVHPILPLGWQISRYALEIMETTVRRPHSPLDTLMMMFGQNFKKQFKSAQNVPATQSKMR